MSSEMSGTQLSTQQKGRTYSHLPMMTQLISNVDKPGFLYQTLTYGLGDACQHPWKVLSSPFSALTSPFNSSLEKQLYTENY